MQAPSAFSSDIHLIQRLNCLGNYTEARAKSENLLSKIPADELFLRNKLLNEFEISSGRAVLESKPRQLVAALSSGCTYNCIMCECRNEPPWNMPESTIREIISLFPYLECVVWLSGETLAYPGLKELIAEGSRHKNLQQVITTNGLLMDDGWSKLITDNKVAVSFSVDAVTDKTSSRIRPDIDFETVKKNIRRFAEFPADRRFELSMVVMRSNVPEMSAYVDLAADLGAGLARFIPIQGNVCPEEVIFFPLDESIVGPVKEQLAAARKRARARGIDLENRLPVRETDEVITHEPAGMPCHMPWKKMCALTRELTVPDWFCHPMIHTLRSGEHGIMDAWNSDEWVKLRSTIASGRFAEGCSSRCKESILWASYLKPI
ncbi:MAG: radical SAM protein [Endomicrobiales bacterium]|nr:radical SAM protein [Endomicrobiales bacterium]